MGRGLNPADEQRKLDKKKEKKDCKAVTGENMKWGWATSRVECQWINGKVLNAKDGMGSFQARKNVFRAFHAIRKFSHLLLIE